jgi:tRNA synthetases class II (A)
VLLTSGGERGDFVGLETYKQSPGVFEEFVCSLDLKDSCGLLPEALLIREKRDETRSAFMDYFVSTLGYQQIEAEPIVPRESVDKSTLFTSASIVPFKPFLIEGTVPENGLAVCQPCMRLHNLATAYDESVVSPWLSEFEMFGTVITPRKFEALEREVYQYLTGVLEIDPQRIVIAASGDDPDLTCFWEGKLNKSQIEINQRDSSFYDWEYGMSEQGITGRGIHIYINPSQPDAGYPRHHVANIIRLEQRGEVIGYEFAIGLEMLLCSTMNLPRPAFATPLCGILQLDDTPSLKEKLADFFSASITLLRADIEPANRGRGYLLKKLLNGTVRTAQQCSMSLEDLGQLIHIYEGRCSPCQILVADTLISLLREQQGILERAVRAFYKRLSNFRDRVSSILPKQDSKEKWIITEQFGRDLGRLVYSGLSELGVAEQPKSLLNRTLKYLNISSVPDETLEWILALGRQDRGRIEPN